MAMGAAVAAAPGMGLAKMAGSEGPTFSRPGFSFLHTYEGSGRYWRGLEKAGLLRRTTGVRLVNSPWADDALRFNSVARADGELHRIIQKRKCPFVIDRVTGGAHYRPYNYDQSLIESYARLLGNKFLGGQVHETVCNTHNDWDRFVSANKKFTTEPINPDELRSYFTCKNAPRCLEYGTVDDYAGRMHPRDNNDFWREIESNFRRESKRFGSHTSYCEGSAWGDLTWHAFYKSGANFCLAELGAWASSKSQFAIASLRGAARAAGKPWGIFYAPWGPEGCTAMVPEKDWSWQCPITFFEGTGWPMGPDRGPSTALQQRLFFHAYLSGAWTLHEEWGAECNLLDWETAQLSCCGHITQALLDFQEKHPDVGEPYTPLALVLDARIPTSDAPLWEEIKTALFQNSPKDKACATRKNSGIAEADCYAPCVVPEIFNIVPADAPASVWNQYKETILVGTGAPPPGAKVFPPEKQAGEIIRSAQKLSPFERSTHLPMQINYRKHDGAWIVGLHNPWGARRGDVRNLGSILNESCAQREVFQPKFSMKSAKVIHAWPASSRLSRHGDTLEAIVGAGGTLIVEVR